MGEMEFTSLASEIAHETEKAKMEDRIAVCFIAVVCWSGRLTRVEITVLSHGDEISGFPMVFS